MLCYTNLDGEVSSWQSDGGGVCRRCWRKKKSERSNKVAFSLLGLNTVAAIYCNRY